MTDIAVLLLFVGINHMCLRCFGRSFFTCQRARSLQWCSHSPSQATGTCLTLSNDDYHPITNRADPAILGIECTLNQISSTSTSHDASTDFQPSVAKLRPGLPVRIPWARWLCLESKSKSNDVPRRSVLFALFRLDSVGFQQVCTPMSLNELQKAGCGLDFTIGRTAELV